MSGKKIYVGNLNYATTGEDLEGLFSDFGKVLEVNVISGKGFGFVEMAEASEADEAIEALNGTRHQGRTIRVAEANAPAEGPRRGPAGPSEPPPPDVPEHDFSDLSDEEIQVKLREMVAESSLLETGFGARRFYFVTREGKMPFIDISDELTSRLEKGIASIVEVPMEKNEEYTVVPRSVAVQMQAFDPESVRFLNAPAPPDSGRPRRPGGGGGRRGGF